MDVHFPLLSTGSALPKQVWPNAALIAAKGLDSSPEWIESRTGIAQRYIVGEGETTFTLARDAVKMALERAGISPAQVGVLIVATCTPDLTFPSVAALIHGDMGFAPNCHMMDVNAACSGFIHGLAVARGLMLGGAGKYAVVVGAETFSKIVDWNDRGTCVLFGDGAGALVMEMKPGKGDGLLGVTLGADGTCAPMLMSSGGVSRTQTAGHVLMNGREVFKHAVRQMGEVPALLGEVGVTLDQVDWLVPHQANVRILEASADALGLSRDKVIITVDRHANTSAATIPLALDVAVGEGKIMRGQTLLLQAFGAGFAWSTAVIKY